jgi:hypothetical protein
MFGLGKNKGDFVETEDFKRDIIAGASLSKCRNITLEYLGLRIFGETKRKIRDIEEEYINCLTNYAKVKYFF